MACHPSMAGLCYLSQSLKIDLSFFQGQKVEEIVILNVSKYKFSSSYCFYGF